MSCPTSQEGIYYLQSEIQTYLDLIRVSNSGFKECDHLVNERLDIFPLLLWTVGLTEAFLEGRKEGTYLRVGPFHHFEAEDGAK